MLFVQLAQGVEGDSLRAGAHAGRVREIQDRIAAVAEDDPLIFRGQKATRPVGCPAAGAFAGGEHHETGKVLRLAAQAVGDPGAHGGTAELGTATEQQQLPR